MHEPGEMESNGRLARERAQGNDDRENGSLTSGSSGNAEQISIEEHEERIPFRSVPPDEEGDNARIRSDESVGPEDEGLAPSEATHETDSEHSTIEDMLPHEADKPV
ncbi:uncharacterized protein [Watersipora subatra]|uniref:uncharacterized protein n=1 Tax=Watersipora subatra TaxID=2589382 RepID=UPI00355AD073